MDPLAGSAWSAAATVAGFTRSPPNYRLIDYAQRLRQGRAPLRVLDIGCGAGRNAVPLTETGAMVMGVDLSWPMVRAASARNSSAALHLALAPMDALPLKQRAFDLIVAHGIWNLARSDAQLRRAIGEAARAAAAGARLFVFTFSRRTLSPQAQPIAGETFTFSQFAGYPQLFLTADQLVAELGAAGFAPDPELPLHELNVPPADQTRSVGVPVIFEGGFRFTGA